MIKTLIVDDMSIVRQGLETMLASDQEIEIIGTARDGLEAVQKAQELEPEVILMDLTLPEINGIEATLLIKKDQPNTKILILSGNLDVECVNKAIKAKANGYLLKTIAQDELCQAIKSVSCGQFLMAVEVAALLASYEPKQKNPINTLTQREVEVLKLVSQGKANKEIANNLHLSEGTIKTHVSIIISKLGMQSRTQVALCASQFGLA